jgi:hypothetical protein
MNVWKQTGNSRPYVVDFNRKQSCFQNDGNRNGNSRKQVTYKPFVSYGNNLFPFWKQTPKAPMETTLSLFRESLFWAMFPGLVPARALQYNWL